MTNQPPIPYSGSHDGPRRLLTLTPRRPWLASPAVHVNIDGATYVLPWASATFDVPADRPVHISVYQQLSGTSSGVAATVLTPEAAPVLEYRAGSSAGAIGPPGTVRARGCGVVLGAITVTLLVVVFLFVILVVILI